MIENIAITLAAVFGVVPASLVQDQDKPAGTGISVAVPSGGVSVNPESVDGEPVYVRRTSPIGGMTVVEISTTPFAPVVGSNEEPVEMAAVNNRPEAQPAGW